MNSVKFSKTSKKKVRLRRWALKAGRAKGFFLKPKTLLSMEVVDPTSYVRPGARRALQLMGAGRRPYEIFEGTLPIKCHSLWAPTGAHTNKLHRNRNFPFVLKKKNKLTHKSNRNPNP